MSALAAPAWAWAGPEVGAAPAVHCPGPPVRIERLADGLWWVPAPGSEADARNRGQVVNLLAARHGGGLWLVGSGPSPAFGRALRCRLRVQTGAPVVAVINPMARAELVLGNRAFADVPVWAPRAVAEAMARQCPGCVARLRAQLGAAARDLGRSPTRLPDRRLDGRSGALGPFEWRSVDRGPGQATSLWTVTAGRTATVFTTAHGLLSGAGPPDGRDAEVERLPGLIDELLAAPGPSGPSAPPAPPARRWLGDQGPLLGADALARQRDYWRRVLAAAAEGVARGETLPLAPPAEDPAWSAHPVHALNWQRAWRQAEDRLLAPPR